MEKNYKVRALFNSKLKTQDDKFFGLRFTFFLFLILGSFHFQAQCNAVTYTTPANNCAIDYISNVTFVTINRNSTCDPLQVYTSPNPTLTAGQTYFLSVTTGGDIEGVRAWIDYNIDGTFNNTSGTELVLGPLFAGTNPATYTANVFIPLTATPGTTKLRVRCNYPAAPADATSPQTWGEIEDYCVTILAAGPCATLTSANSVANTTAAICIGSSSTLTATGQVSYTWNPGGSNASSITVSPTTNSSYTVQGTNSLGCIFTTVVSVPVNTAVPTLSIASTASVLCVGRTMIVTASGANTYTWSNGMTNGAVYTPTATSTFVVTGENACGTSTAVTSVSLNPAPNISASVNHPTVCSGNNIILNGGGSVAGYTWSAGVPNNSAFAPAATTVYTVTGVGANGCTNTAVQGVTVLISPTITPVVTPTAMCIGETATLTGMGATGYTWIPGTNLNTATLTVSPPISTTYTLFRTLGVCASTSTVSLLVYQLPFVSATAVPNLICAGTGVNLIVTGAITNTWQPSGLSGANLIVYPNLSTCYTVTGSNGNCTASAAVCVTVNPAPVLSINASSLTICQGQSVNLTAGGGLTYTWQPMNSNNTVEMVSPTTTSSYTLMGTNALGCTASLSNVIVVNQVPDMTLLNSSAFICAGQTATLSVANVNSNISYSWSTGAIGSFIPVSPTVTTSYVATGTNTNTNCLNTNTIILSVFISTFTVMSPTAICMGGTGILTAVGAATSYSWSANGGVVSPSVAVSPVNSTTYSVIGINGSCSSATNVPLVVNPLPVVTAFAAKKLICRFEASTITGSGAPSYSWNTGATTPTISVTLTVTTNYTLTGTDLNGCSDTVTVTQFVSTCIGIEDFADAENVGVTIYPNPNNGTFYLSSDGNVDLSLINALGQVITTIKLSETNKREIRVDKLPTGIYFILGESNGIKINKKIIIER